LHQLRREVDQILAVIGSVDTAPSVATATDIYAQILLTTLGREFARNETPLHSGVQALLDHDRARGTEYRSTLCTYFGALGDVAETARQLNIHPNTLRYRLRRAAVGFGVPLGYPDDILTTWLQLRLAPNQDGHGGQ
jgi:DNA-binding PucR family transcriptional regulator